VRDNFAARLDRKSGFQQGPHQSAARDLHAGEAEDRRTVACGDEIPQGAQDNDTITGDVSDVGFVLQGGMYNQVIAALRALGLADDFGGSRIPLHVLNCVYPLVPDELAAFCAW